MDLKFTFGGTPGHDHAPAGSAAVPVSHSTELDVVVRVDREAAKPRMVAEVVTGDGVTYSRGEVPCDVDESAADERARAARSAIARAVAGLEGPLAGSITSIVLDFADARGTLASLGVAEQPPAVTHDLQARIGVNAGVPIRIG